MTNITIRDAAGLYAYCWFDDDVIGWRWYLVRVRPDGVTRRLDSAPASSRRRAIKRALRAARRHNRARRRAGVAALRIEVRDGPIFPRPPAPPPLPRRDGERR